MKKNLRDKFRYWTINKSYISKIWCEDNCVTQKLFFFWIEICILTKKRTARCILILLGMSRHDSFNEIGSWSLVCIYLSKSFKTWLNQNFSFTRYRVTNISHPYAGSGSITDVKIIDPDQYSDGRLQWHISRCKLCDRSIKLAMDTIQLLLLI